MQIKDSFFAILAMILWGLTLPFGKIALESYPPLLMQALRLSIVGIFALLFFLREFPRPHFWSLFFIAFTMFTFVFGPNTISMNYVDSSIVALIGEFEVPFTVLLSVLYLKEKIQLSQATGNIIALLGVLWLTSSAQVTNSNFFAIILLLISAFSTASSHLQVKLIPLNPITITCWAYVLATPQLFALSFLLEKNQVSIIHQSSFDSNMGIALSALCSFGAFSIWTFLLKKYPIHHVTPYALLLSFFATVSAYVILGEIPDSKIMGGGFLIIIGMAIQSQMISLFFKRIAKHLYIS